VSMFNWMVTFPRRLIIVNILHSFINHDLLLAFYHYLSLHHILALYFISTSRNNVNVKSFNLLSSLLLFHHRHHFTKQKYQNKKWSK
jgi:hypothetical protein